MGLKWKILRQPFNRLLQHTTLAYSMHGGIKGAKLISGGRNESVALRHTLACSWETLAENRTADSSDQSTESNESGEKRARLQRDSGLFLALFAAALTSGQPAFQLLRHPLIAVLAHRPQINFNKLISE